MSNYHSQVDVKIAALRNLLNQLDELEPSSPAEPEPRSEGKWLHRAGRHSQYLNI